MNGKPAFPRSGYARITCFIVVGVGIPLLFIPWNDTYHPRSLKLAWNFGHVLLYGGAASLLFVYWHWFRIRSYEAQIGILVVLALSTGLAIEAIQLYTGGDFSLQDVCLDITGACLVAAIKPQFSNSLIKYSPWILRLAVISYLLLRAYPVGVSLVDEYRAYRQFPVLADFGSPLELDRFGGAHGLKFTDEGMEVSFGTEKYSGFSLKYFRRDWSGYHDLNIEIQNPEDTDVYLTCRIHDQHHNQSYQDRYNRRFRVIPGAQRIKIDLDAVRAAPRTRTMDMEKIGGLGCFTVSLATPVTLIIRKIALSNFQFAGMAPSY